MKIEFKGVSEKGLLFYTPTFKENLVIPFDIFKMIITEKNYYFANNSVGKRSYFINFADIKSQISKIEKEYPELFL